MGLTNVHERFPGPPQWTGTEPEAFGPKHRLQDIKLQGRNVVHDFDVADEADSVMRGTVKEFSSIEVKNDLTLGLSAANGKTIISGIELIHQD